MRFWLSGPRMLDGLVRPGVSFSPKDLRRLRSLRPATPSVVGFIVSMIIAVPLAAIAIGGFWIAAMLFSELIRG
jgi:hypothetical protein